MTGFPYRQSYPLPRGYSVEFELDGLQINARWAPRRPHPKIARKLLPSYRRARNEFLRSLDVNTMVIEL